MNRPPLVLVHGFPLDKRVWDGQVAELSKTGEVIAVDLPGFGQNKSDAPFTIASLADHLHQTLSKKPFVLAGLSMGGYVALEYARRYPADLRGLILLDTRAEADTEEGKQNRMKMVDLVRSGGSEAVARRMEPKMVCDHTRTHRPQVLEKLMTIMRDCPPETIEHALIAMRDRDDLSGFLPSISIPVKVIVGQHDELTPPTLAHQMHERIKGSSVSVIPNAGHMAPMEEVDQVNAALSQFMSAIH